MDLPPGLPVVQRLAPARRLRSELFPSTGPSSGLMRIRLAKCRCSRFVPALLPDCTTTSAGALATKATAVAHHTW